jgi:glycosyltransferase involved in cell wall biosynthesis
LKVVFDSQIFSAQEYGGISRYFFELAKSFSADRSVSIRIVAPMHINAYIANLSGDLVKGFSCPAFIRSSQSKWAKMFRRVFGLLLGDLAIRIFRPNIIHETYYSPLKFGGEKVKRVLTIYDMIHEKFTDQFPSSDKTALYKSIAAQRADHVICISESTRRDVIDLLGLDPSKVSVTYLGFSALGTAPSSLSAVDRVIKPYILFVGNRAGYKNFKTLLSAYSSSRVLRDNFQLICFGGGKFTDLELLEMAEAKLEENSILQFFGDDQRLSSFYANAHAFIYPSLYEGFGIPPLEAMANNCPVVCSSTSSIPEVVGNAGEYFDPYDTDSLIGAIERVIGSESRMEELRRNGQKRLDFFSWENCAQDTLKIYKKIL